jgi:calcineurin-like phosphoesterase family protein
MATFVTADLHFNHANIIRYCNRPFDDVNDMNDCLVENWNRVVAMDDTVFHIGDFCFRKNINGIYQGVDYWKSKLNGNIILIAGNHDKYLAMKSLTIYFSNKAILIRHNPIYNAEDMPSGIEYVLCGHCHNKWDKRIVGNTRVINVGVDVSDFKPNQLAEVVKQNGEYNEYE